MLEPLYSTGSNLGKALNWMTFGPPLEKNKTLVDDLLTAWAKFTNPNKLAVYD